eukprot:m.153186 g.153186  ORF g.153186 m.153186 type:complete len:176 (-) comp52855_c0_seq1:200-727(-)
MLQDWTIGVKQANTVYRPADQPRPGPVQSAFPRSASDIESPSSVAPWASPLTPSSSSQSSSNARPASKAKAGQRQRPMAAHGRPAAPAHGAFAAAAKVVHGAEARLVLVKAAQGSVAPSSDDDGTWASSYSSPSVADAATTPSEQDGPPPLADFDIHLLSPLFPADFVWTDDLEL